ncbi:hypothetical protein GIB67_002805 [Kingdonia uniflora]|uniref:Uncharacterized protein n=1 Tax=Kingdonia uniflora TaxID=39325 RepID=A0A7J7M574_9MAGN|nr:hypothetical protein GIB67_002805 [Kingdonia uniflora]
MESGTSIRSMVRNLRKTTRRGPLRTCGVTILTIAQKTYTRVENQIGPIGFVAQKLAKYASPISYAMQHQWLAILSFGDNCILAAEHITETIFPLSTRLFDKIDGFVQVTESIPDKLDSITNKLSSMAQHVPLLAQWAMILNFLIITIKDWGSNDAKEKEIRVDINSHNSNDNLASQVEAEKPNNQDDHQLNGPPICDGSIVSEVKGTYKEVLQKKKEQTYKDVLEMGKKDESQGESEVKEVKDRNEEKSGESKDQRKPESRGEITTMKENIKGMVLNEDEIKDDSILELFAAGWHMT